MLSPDEKKITHSVAVLSTCCFTLLTTAIEVTNRETTCANGGSLNDNGSQCAKPMRGIDLKECVDSVIILIIAAAGWPWSGMLGAAGGWIQRWIEAMG